MTDLNHTNKNPEREQELSASSGSQTVRKFHARCSEDVVGANIRNDFLKAFEEVKGRPVTEYELQTHKVAELFKFFEFGIQVGNIQSANH